MLLLPQSVTGLLSAGSIMHMFTRRSSASSAQHPQRGSNGIAQRLLLTSNAQRDVAVASAGLLPAVGGSTLGTAQGLRSAPCYGTHWACTTATPTRTPARGFAGAVVPPTSKHVSQQGARRLAADHFTSACSAGELCDRAPTPGSIQQLSANISSPRTTRPTLTTRQGTQPPCLKEPSPLLTHKKKSGASPNTQEAGEQAKGLMTAEISALPAVLLSLLRGRQRGHRDTSVAVQVTAASMWVLKCTRLCWQYLHDW